MIDVAKANGDKELINRYLNTYHCQTKLTSTNGRYYCNWCKNRFCTTCWCHVLFREVPVKLSEIALARSKMSCFQEVSLDIEILIFDVEYTITLELWSYGYNPTCGVITQCPFCVTM